MPGCRGCAGTLKPSVRCGSGSSNATVADDIAAKVGVDHSETGGRGGGLLSYRAPVSLLVVGIDAGESFAGAKGLTGGHPVHLNPGKVDECGALGQVGANFSILYGRPSTGNANICHRRSRQPSWHRCWARARAWCLRCLRVGTVANGIPAG